MAVARLAVFFPPELHEDQAAFVAPEPAGPPLSELVASIPRSERNTVDFLVELNQRLQRMIRCLIRMEPARTNTGRDFEVRRRIVPRHGLAFGAAPAPYRPAGALRVRLSDGARELNPGLIFSKRANVRGFPSTRYTFETMNAAIAANTIKPVIDRVFGFEEVQAAMAAGAHFGKIVVRVA